MKDLKYLIAYLAPISAFLGVYWGGIWSLGSVYIAFGIIPFLEFFTPNSKENFSQEEENTRNSNRFFDFLLYLNLPILYALIFYTLFIFSQGTLTLFEQISTILNIGTMAGILGINVAHELGHRFTWYEQLMSKILLVIPLYMHFYIEHNRGHHKQVATLEDPASSRLGENLYRFWIRSITGSYLNAWHLEKQKLARLNKPAFHYQNEMIWYQVIQFIYLFAVWYFLGILALIAAAAIAIVGFLLLETVNYIEHYGLLRKKMPNGRYETVKPIHSWNSNHEIGRIFLYELSRHADHHYKSARKFQTLRHLDESPQLPFGYPMAMLISLIPPLWFSIMDEKVKVYL